MKAVNVDEVLKILYRYGEYIFVTDDKRYSDMVDEIANLKALEQQPKTGHWIDIMVGDMPAQACDQCKTFYPLSYTGGGHNYCPSCGSRMVEPQESEDKE
jgi:hypothetical protein